jgi:hypothetical protein
MDGVFGFIPEAIVQRSSDRSRAKDFSLELCQDHAKFRECCAFSVDPVRQLRSGEASSGFLQHHLVRPSHAGGLCAELLDPVANVLDVYPWKGYLVCLL